jgi:DNA polymerase-3 subunit delta
VKLARGAIGRALDRPDPAIRLYLFHGPDEAQSRGHASRLLEALGAEKFVLAGGAVKSDPAVLVDEAGAMSLFGGKRAIWIEPAGDEIGAGVEALLEAGAPESPVIAIGGALRKTSSLLKLAEASPNAAAFAAYVPEGADAQRMVVEVGRRFGLKLSAPVAARIGDDCGNDQAIVAQELQKLALFIDASPQAPKELGFDALEAVGADLQGADFSRLADLALLGQVGELADELARVPGGAEAIPVIRALQRRIGMLAPMRGKVERGDRPDAVMTSLGKALFWKDKPAVEAMLRKWSAADLATVAERAGKLERDLMLTPVPAQDALGEELISIARKARRL